MSPTSASFLRGNGSPTLSARMAELVQYMSAPLLGRLTDEQRSLSLAVARRLVVHVARHIDADMDVEALWADWARDGVPVTDDLALACFARAEEHRWRAASEQAAIAIHAGNGHAALSVLPTGQGMTWPSDELATAYQALQLADRRRFDNFGYPRLCIADISDDLFRHLLNEIARWRLHRVSADRKSSAGLGDAVRSAWRQKSLEVGIDAAAQPFFHQLVAANFLSDQVNDAIFRRDWSCFLALVSAAQAQRYSDMALFFMTTAPSQWMRILAPLRVNSDAQLLLEESITLLPARACGADLGT
jgi:hypothetical protein